MRGGEQRREEIRQPLLKVDQREKWIIIIIIMINATPTQAKQFQYSENRGRGTTSFNPNCLGRVSEWE